MSAQTNGVNGQKAKVKSPMSLAHVVLHTNQLPVMRDFWTTFLGAEITHGDDNMTFLRYDDEHHRIALIAIPGTTDKVPSAAGLGHVAFTFETLDDLAETYQQRKALGITPMWCVNHGPTTSMYYKDPDGNMIETQVDNFDSPKEADDFMKSSYFAENPIGTDFDPDEFVARIKKGEDPASIKKRVEIGPRGIPAL